jgi:hypothetical protein
MAPSRSIGRRRSRIRKRSISVRDPGVAGTALLAVGVAANRLAREDVSVTGIRANSGAAGRSG